MLKPRNEPLQELPQCGALRAHHWPWRTAPTADFRRCKTAGDEIEKPDDDLLSHEETSHYHRRGAVSLLSSGRDQVVPTRYGRQTNRDVMAGAYRLVGQVDRQCDALVHMAMGIAGPTKIVNGVDEGRAEDDCFGVVKRCGIALR